VPIGGTSGRPLRERGRTESPTLSVVDKLKRLEPADSGRKEGTITNEAQGDIPENGAPVPFNDLLWELSGGDTSSYPPFEEETFRLMQEGIVGRSYTYENIWTEEEPCVARAYYVWRKTAETTESDRQLEKLDREWALMTGGMFSYDRDVLLLELKERERRAGG
jgi:hypothetical protein